MNKELEEKKLLFSFCLIYGINVRKKEREENMNQILIVEDDNTIANNLKFYLETEGFSVDCVDNYQETLQKLANKKYQIILLDVMIHGGNGFDMFHTIEQMSKAGIIYLTALDDEEDIVKGLELGAEDYVTKPFHARELLTRIHKVLKRREKEEEKKITIQDVTIDLQENKVYKKGKELLDITGLEYKLLRFLFENKGRTITRDEILEKIWDSEENFVNDNTLTVYIKRIRNKIENPESKEQIIKTVRGIGYRIG